MITIRCTENEKSSIITGLLQSDYCILLDCGARDYDDCRNGDGCLKCLEQSINWEVIK